MSTSANLNTPILEGGLERVPFFNGRVLTAEDLQTEQAANATERKRLGRALGTGVIEGHFVDRVDGESNAPPTAITVESGLALAPSGRIVELPSDVELSVVSEIDRKEMAGTKGQFASCSAREVVMTSGTGAYVLFAEPASEPQGRTPRTTLGGDGAAGECGAERRVEGARLRLVHLDTGDEDLVPPSLAKGDGDDEADSNDNINGLAGKIVGARERGETPTPKHVSKLRNLLAHVCLGTPSALTDTASLYDTLRDQSRGNAEPVGGPLEVLRMRARERDRVDDLDDAVPLCLLYWSGDRIEFVDVWSVRRRVHRPDSQRPAPATARRRAETEAAIYQFQDHLADLVDALTAGERQLVRARDFMKWLPPVGLIPVQTSETDGLRSETFFEGLKTRLEGLASRDTVVIEGEHVRALFQDARYRDPIPVSRDELVWMYEVRENRQISSSSEAVPYVLFATGYQPFFGDAQYNLARWDHSNYGPVVQSR